MTAILWNVDSDGNWSATADWSPALQPGVGDDVAIDTTHYHTIYFDTGTVTINSLIIGNDDFTISGGSLALSSSSSFGRALNILGGALAVNAATTVTGQFSQGGGTLSGTGTLTLEGGAVLTSGLMTGAGTTVLKGSSSLNSSGLICLDGGRTLENEGTLTIANATSAFSIILGQNPGGTTLGGATLQNDASGVITFNSTRSGVANIIAGVSGTVTVNNAGLIQSTGGNTEITAPLVNTGTVSVTAGELDLDGGGSSAASALSVSAGATLSFGAYTSFNLGAGATNGSGTIKMAGGNLSVFGPTTITGAFVQTGGVVSETGTLTLASGATLSGGTLGLGGSTTVSGLFSQTGGTISGAGTLTLAGGALFSPSGSYGVMTGSGTTVLQGSSTLSGNSFLYLDGGRTLENQGTFTLSGFATLNLGANPNGTTGNATLQNDAAGTIIFNYNMNHGSAVSAILASYGTLAFNNAGLLQNIGGDPTIINGPFTNTGTVSVVTGELDINGGGSSAASAFTVASGATLAFNTTPSVDSYLNILSTNVSTFTLNGGSTSGTGTIVLDGGTLAVGGSTTITGLFRQVSNSRVSGTGTLTLAGGADFYTYVYGVQDVMTGSGTTILQGTSTLGASDRTGGDLSLDGGRTLENQGTFTATNTSIDLGYIPNGIGIGGGTLQNDAGGTIIFNSTGSGSSGVVGGSGAIAFNNAGTVQKVGSGDTYIYAPFSNTGTVLVTAGGLVVKSVMTGSGTVAIGGGATFALDASSTSEANSITLASGSTGLARLTGGSGNDAFDMNGGLITGDHIDGGAGYDTLILDGDYSAGLTFGPATITNVEKLVLEQGSSSGLNSYNFTTDAATIAAGQTLTVDGSALLGTLRFDDTAGKASTSLVITGGAGNDTLTGGAGGDTLEGGAGVNHLDGGSNVNTAVEAGPRSAYTITQTSVGNFTITGTNSTDYLTNIQYVRFSDQVVHLLPGTGTAITWSADPSTYMAGIRDFDGNDLGGASSWKLIGSADVNGSGTQVHVLFNRQIGRWAEVGTASDGKTYFDNHGWAGDTRVVGIYIDPLVTNGTVVKGSDTDSQRRFQNDLMIDNIRGILGTGDYNHDGLQEIYFSLTDGTAYLHAYMWADGNIQYANYQTKQQVIDYLTTNGWSSSTYAGWFPSSQAAPDMLVNGTTAGMSPMLNTSGSTALLGVTGS